MAIIFMLSKKCSPQQQQQQQPKSGEEESIALSFSLFRQKWPIKDSTNEK